MLNQSVVLFNAESFIKSFDDITTLCTQVTINTCIWSIDSGFMCPLSLYIMYEVGVNLCSTLQCNLFHFMRI